MPPLHTLTINLSSVPATAPIALPVGVVFASYALIARPARLAQLLAWCRGRKRGVTRDAFEGVVCLDECHRAKARALTQRPDASPPCPARPCHPEARPSLALLVLTPHLYSSFQAAALRHWHRCAPATLICSTPC
jgi:hypothetical protein